MIFKTAETDPLLFEKLTRLGFTQEFCLVCEIAGFHNLADLLDYQTSQLLKLPGFNYHLLGELVTFLEKKDMGHLVDP